MNFNTPLTPAQQIRFSEGSKLASKRDSRNVSQSWIKENGMAKSIDENNLALERVIREVAKLKRRIVGGGSSQDSQFKDFTLVSDGGDYYNCKDENGTIVKVAKHQDIRCGDGAWADKVIRGVTYTYSYFGIAGTTTDGVDVVEYRRDVVGSDGSSETDYITPCLNVGDIITGFATSFQSPESLTDVTYQALADGRAWAAIPS
jgi:hypothetical protein